MTIRPCVLLSVFFVLAPVAASAQVYRCADSAGKIQFSDMACAAGEKSSEVRIHAGPSAPAQRMSADAVVYEKARQQRRQQSDDSHQRIDDSAAKVQAIRNENYDARKCAAARGRMADMERRDPLTYKISMDYVEYQQKASLHCGN